ncbi:DUF2333 domain-containing protein [Saccharobesus litoralis]|uniref:DUF2333 domain-containing protein n=1 Tax=Saccharobesus litoralis TaxID=2172099 RepID=A0A2S0VY05_9ALTE|nr:DUF2333 family protein [Saccharobesus litoralis]AWB69091.1 DUF2333 domain-containing protein [Saccharobesus litoralis]
MSITLGFILVIILLLSLSIWWGWMPNKFDVKHHTKQVANELNQPVVPGYTTTTTLIEVANWMLDKPGGFLSNDVLPPSVVMDNMPAFEYGVLQQVRDLALAMRLDFSRSQSQSTDDKDLEKAQPKFNIDHTNWAFPSAEDEYRNAIKALIKYRDRLVDNNTMDGQFYTRADNLSEWLREVEKRLGAVSQRLSASVGQERLNTDLAGDTSARQSTSTPNELNIKTSWWKIDDVFYESRGTCWALLHFLQAIETDFHDVLVKKNALVSLQQIIRELESTQQQIYSPIILNGSGFGLVANHSLVMANYVSRANAALIDLRTLLEQG